MKLCMGCMNQIDDNAMTCPHCGFNESIYQQESYYLNPGTIVGGKYIVGKVLKYGGHTVSYLGMDAEVNRKVIVKEYLPSDFSTRSEGETEITIYSGDAKEQFENGLTNFLNEANIFQSLGEVDGIARVYDCLAENDTGYVISEYVQGKTLSEILSSRKRYSVNEAKAIIEKLLKGLSKVHMQNIIHCDISPETIMITDAGEAKLVDFGATRYVTTSNSKSLAIILKQGYAAEEQYRSSGRRGPWTDVYALAAVMYRMITGVTPQESVERALLDELKAPSKIGIAIAENVENALLNALNIYKAERTPNAQVFLQELNSPSVKRIKTQKRSNDTGKFPVWAKVLVASLLCLVIVGGTIIVIKGIHGSSDINTGNIAWKDFTGDTIEQVEEYMETNKHNVTIVSKTVYDADESKNGTIEKSSITIDDINRAKNSESSDGAEIKVDNDNHVTATLVCTVYSSKKISYEELSTLNAFSIANKMKVETDAEIFEKETDEEGSYFDIEEIRLKEGNAIGISEIKDAENKEKIIEISDIDKIVYYAGAFFYWEQVPKFEGYNINDDDSHALFNPNVYEKENENSSPKKTDNTKCLYQDETLCDNDSFSVGYPEGYVYKQTITVGEKFDVTKDMDKLDDDGKLLYIVGKSFKDQISTGENGDKIKADIEQYLDKQNVCDWAGSKDGTQPVTKVEIYKTDENGNDIIIDNGCARRTDNIHIKIYTKEKQAPTTRYTSTTEETTISH